MSESTIDFRGVVLACDFNFEPAGIGGDWDERLPACVEIETVKAGGVDILGLLGAQAVEQLEAQLLLLLEQEELAA